MPRCDARQALFFLSAAAIAGGHVQGGEAETPVFCARPDHVASRSSSISRTSSTMLMPDVDEYAASAMDLKGHDLSPSDAVGFSRADIGKVHTVIDTCIDLRMCGSDMMYVYRSLWTFTDSAHRRRRRHSGWLGASCGVGCCKAWRLHRHVQRLVYTHMRECTCAYECTHASV